MRPGPRLFWALAIWLGASAGVSIWEGLEAAWLGLGLAIISFAVVDAWGLRRQPVPDVRRRLPHSLPLGVWSDIHVRLINRDPRPRTAEIFDHYPVVHSIQALPQRVVIPGDGWAEITYRLLPNERGEHRFGRVQVLSWSPLGMWRRDQPAGEPEAIRVYPNFAAVSKYALLATDNHLSQIGVRKRRLRGEGLEFHQLREYREGDSLRQVDWKATARQGKLVSREYQAERDQQVFFLVDCGRRMTARDDALSHFDHGLNSVLLLAYVALRQGDAVGLMTFGGEKRYLPPQKGMGAVNTVLNLLYDLQPSLHSPDYAEAATHLLGRLRKRSLVVVVTNLRDEDAGEILPTLHLLKRQHLVLLASLRERAIGAVLDRTVDGFDAALTLAAAQRYLLARRKVHDAIGESGALSLDVEPERLPIALVNRYLEIKSSGRL